MAAFEAYLGQEAAKPRARQRITIGASVAIHAIALIVALVYSFWHVDELSPPTVTVTFMSAPPPPPPPPPPPKRHAHATTKPKVPTEVVQPRPNEIVQPKEKEEKKEEPEDEEGADDNGVEGGVKGGVVGGVTGGVVGAAPAPTAEPPKQLPPAVAEQQKLSAPNPQVPAVLQANAGARIFNLLKICVSAEGAIASVKVIKPSDPLWDKSCLETVQGSWKFKAAMVNGRPVPFCYNSRFDLVVTSH